MSYTQGKPCPSGMDVAATLAGADPTRHSGDALPDVTTFTAHMIDNPDSKLDVWPESCWGIVAKLIHERLVTSTTSTRPVWRVGPTRAKLTRFRTLPLAATSRLSR